MKALRTIFLIFVSVALIMTTLTVEARTRGFTTLDSLMNRAVADSIFPGASIAVLRHGKTVYHKAFGRLSYEPESAPANTGTIYDAASLTKAIVTTSIVMQLVERDSLDLRTPVSRYRPGFTANGKGEVTIEQLLRHTSGLRPHSYFAETCANRQDALQAIDCDTLTCKPGTRTQYSDLNFILLGSIIEQITGSNLAASFQARFAEPLGITSTLFTPPDSLRQRIAPTGEDGIWKLNRSRPLVNDQNAALFDGIAGHAGMFTTTGDLQKMVQMIMNEGKLDGRRFIKASTARRFLKRTDAPRALGWDLVSPGGKSSAGHYFSASSWGHLGFTGTSIWVDPDKDLAVILLSNRVWPTPENIRIRKFRPILHDTVVECIGK